MVGRNGHVGSHRTYRIRVRSSVLNLLPFPRVRVIAGPALRRIVQQSRIKTPSSAGAGLKQNLWKRRIQTVVQVIQPQDIPVEDLPLTLRAVPL